MTHFAYKFHYLRYQILLYLPQIRLAQKHSKLPVCYVTDCLKEFHLEFRLLAVIQIPGDGPILVKKKTYQKKNTANAVEIFPISIFDLKQTCKIVPTEFYSILNFTATYFDDVSINTYKKALKLLKMLLNKI